VGRRGCEGFGTWEMVVWGIEEEGIDNGIYRVWLCTVKCIPSVAHIRAKVTGVALKTPILTL
jgi:hypothetical protein